MRSPRAKTAARSSSSISRMVIGALVRSWRGLRRLPEGMSSIQVSWEVRGRVKAAAKCAGGVGTLVNRDNRHPKAREKWRNALDETSSRTHLEAETSGRSPFLNFEVRQGDTMRIGVLTGGGDCPGLNA